MLFLGTGLTELGNRCSNARGLYLELRAPANRDGQN
jgi:hypothetical protein